jgi:hypothetical protein
MLGDGVWEGIRLHKGVLTAGHEHITRLFEGSKSLDMDLQVRACRACDIRTPFFRKSTPKVDQIPHWRFFLFDWRSSHFDSEIDKSGISTPV